MLLNKLRRGPARRQLEEAHVQAVDRQPRLVLRFALVTALSLGLGGAAILVFTRHLNTFEAEKTAGKHAQFLADQVLSDQLHGSDFARPVTASRRAQLDRVFKRKVLRPGTVLVTLSRRDRVVTYSTDHTLIARRTASAPRTAEALSGTVTSEVTSIPRAEDGRRLKVLRSYVPLTVGGSAGVIAIYQDYRPIETAARAALLPVAGILEVVLALLFAMLVPLLARVTRRLRRHAERIHQQAFYDDLTGLPNRPHFRAQVIGVLEAARGNDTQASVLLLDLDRFKEINETLGHPSGDEVVRACADRLRALISEGTMLARLGGDEFAVVAEVDTVAAATLAEEIRTSLQAPFLVRGIPLVVEASIGIATYPDNGRDVDAMLRTADAAMYVAKGRRLGVAVYDGTLEESTMDALQLVSELRPALERRELILHFQPQIAVESGAVTGAEALVRWQHPERGLLQPGAFVPLVERTGASKALSDYVLSEAAAQLRRWRENGFDLSVAVNLTTFDLLDVSLPGKISDLLGAAGLPPERLELEITESLIMSDPQRVREVVELLKEIGVRLAIDDFGTGYSSLSYLKTLPVDVIKIDRSFVMAMGANESDAAIVRSTIDLAHNLDLRVVAEGVEDGQTLDELARFECDFAQGYFISRPCGASDFWSSVAAFAEKREAAA
jgi:diguanylate cyclase (GGDEF)-like protein